MADDQDTSPFADDENNATQLLQGLISPAPAQSLVAPPPDTPPPTKPGQSTPITGSLATPPSQATPKVSPAPESANERLSNPGGPAYDASRAMQLEDARSDAIPIDPYQGQYQPGLGAKIRRGLAGYFSGGIGAAPSGQTSALQTGTMGRTGTLRQSAESKERNAKQPAAAPDRSRDPNYVKVVSNGHIGYLPKANLTKAQQRDKNLRVLK